MRVVIKNIGTKPKLQARLLSPKKKETKRSLRGLTKLEQFLDEDGIKDDATLVALKRVVALQLEETMRLRHMTKTQLAQKMHTSRAQVDRVLDPEQGNVTLETLVRAAKILGRSLQLKLV